MRILHIDDDRMERLGFKGLFSDQCGTDDRLVQVGTIEEAREAVNSQDFDLVVLDACVPGVIPNTLPLVRMWRREQKGFKIIGVSRSPDYLPGFIEAGCDGAIGKSELYTAANFLVTLQQLEGC